MKIDFTLATVGTILMVSSMANAASSGPRFYGDPPDEHHPWAVHDGNRPQPKIVTPGAFATADKAAIPPSDAIVLFDGSDLSKWESNGGPAKWVAKDGYMEAKPGAGDIQTKEKFGDCQLHVEWAAPKDIKGDSQGRGNSGIFLMGMLEIQVLDTYNNPTYADGHAGAYYGINPPMASPLRPPGEYQVYDIVFRRPIYKEGKVVDPGYVTVFINGVLVQDHTTLEGPGGHVGRTKAGPFPEVGPLRLQDHGNPVRFRSIWYRPLPPRASEGGTDGYLSTEATMAKRKEIAAGIRKDAETIKGSREQMFRLMESLVYEKHEATYGKVEQMATDYVNTIKQLSGNELQAKKDEAKHLSDVFKYLVKAKAVPADFAPKATIEQLIKDQGWDKKKK